MRQFVDNNYGSAIPIVYYILTIFALGALYTLLFVEVAFPFFRDYVPDGPSKTFIMMLFYGIPLLLLVVGAVALLIQGVKVLIPICKDAENGASRFAHHQV